MRPLAPTLPLHAVPLDGQSGHSAQPGAAEYGAPSTWRRPESYQHPLPKSPLRGTRRIGKSYRGARTSDTIPETVATRSMSTISESFSGQRVLVTGACGGIGG